MFVRKGKKRSSLQLASNTVTRLRKQTKTCLVIEEQEEEIERKKQLAALSAQLKAIILRELEQHIEQLEQWNRDKYDIVRKTWQLFDAVNQPTVMMQAPLKQDEQPECPVQKMVWRKLPINGISDRRLALNAATGLTKLNFYNWGREKIQNSDTLVPLDMSLQLPPQSYGPEESQLSEMRKKYLQKAKVKEQFASSAKKRPQAETLIDGKSQTRQKINAKEFTFDYNGNKITQERRKESIVQPTTLEPGQFEVKEGPSLEKKTVKVEKFENKAEEDKCKNIIKDTRKLKQNSSGEDAVPSKLETGVSIYSQDKSKTELKEKPKASITISNQVVANQQTPSPIERKAPAIKPRKESTQHNSSLESSTIHKQEIGLRNKQNQHTHRTERTEHSSLHSHSKNEYHQDRILINPTKEISKENIQNLFKVTMTRMSAPNITKEETSLVKPPHKSKFIQDLAPVTLKLPRIQ